MDKSNAPTHGALLLYALSVYCFYYGVQAAVSDILGTSPNANGLFPSTTSNYDISAEPYKSSAEDEKAAQSDIDLLTRSGDEDIAEAYGRASTESEEA